MTTICLYILTALATARLTRLITTDKISEPARQWLITRLGATSKIVYLAHCPWCMSIWVAALTTPAYWHLANPTTHLPHPPTTATTLIFCFMLILSTAHLSALILTELESR